MPTETEIISTSIVNAARALYDIVRGDTVAAAEAMPESGYSHKPDPQVRSFGQQVAHIADANYLFASCCLGESNPFPGVSPLDAGVLEKTKNNKEEIVRALLLSFEYCDRAFNATSDATLA